MIEAIARVNEDYLARLADDPDRARADMDAINNYCADHGAIYNGRPVPIPLKPHFISPGQQRMLEEGLARIHAVLERFITLWLEDEGLQAAWNVSADELDLYKVDPGYAHAIQVARFDAFLHDMDLKFLEFNCDSPGGTGFADVIHQGFVEMFTRDPTLFPHAPPDVPRLLHLTRALMEAYTQWRQGRGDRPERPFMVVSDWRDVGTLSDIQITIGHMQNAGVDAVFADPRDMELQDDGLYLKDRRVDLVYKRVIVKELVSDPDAGALAAAYKRGQVCLVNCPRSVIVGNKKILAGLRLPQVLDQLSPSDRQAVEDWIPWAAFLRQGPVEFEGAQEDLRTLVLRDKDLFVLKAAQSYGGRDVMLGFEATPERWEELVDAHIEDNDWIVQELVDIPQEPFPQLVDDHVEACMMNVNINPLAFGGRYAGSYTRVSTRNVINVSHGGGMTATMTIDGKEGGP